MLYRITGTSQNPILIPNAPTIFVILSTNNQMMQYSLLFVVPLLPIAAAALLLYELVLTCHKVAQSIYYYNSLGLHSAVRQVSQTRAVFAAPPFTVAGR